jgi:hypothetical protein
LPNSNLESLNRTVMDQMLIDDFVNVGLVNIAIPSSLGIDHHDWTIITTIEAACAVNPNLSWPAFFQGFYFFLRVGLHLVGAASCAAGGAIFSLVYAEKDMFFKVAHVHILALSN